MLNPLFQPNTEPQTHARSQNANFWVWVIRTFAAMLLDNNFHTNFPPKILLLPMPKHNTFWLWSARLWCHFSSSKMKPTTEATSVGSVRKSISISRVKYYWLTAICRESTGMRVEDLKQLAAFEKQCGCDANYVLGIRLNDAACQEWRMPNGLEEWHSGETIARTIICLCNPFKSMRTMQIFRVHPPPPPTHTRISDSA